MNIFKYITFILRSAFADFNRNKGRTFLTSLGILIGVFSVVLLMAFGLGLRKYITNQFESLGTNLIMVIPGSKSSLTQGGGIMGGIRFDERDVVKIKRIQSVSTVAPIFTTSGMKIEFGGKIEIGKLVASNEEIMKVMNLEVLYGRGMSKTDVDKRTKMVLVSEEIAKKLFIQAELALGKIIKLNKQSYKVTGILKSKGGGGLGGGGLDSNVYIPYKAGYIFFPDKKFFGIYLKSQSQEDVELTKLEVERILQKRYDKDDFSVYEQKEIIETISSIFGIINLVLVAIAAVSLVVGGVGIMNIMYVSVTERIKEIGIRRALGARKKDILWQFLVEAVALSMLGGVLGLALSFIIVLGIQQIFPAYIDVTAVLLALGVSSGIGVLFGVFPAKKAADLSPIDAIRYE